MFVVFSISHYLDCVDLILLQDQSLSLTIGIVNTSVVSSFVYSHPIGGTEAVSLAIEDAVTVSEQILVEVTRFEDIATSAIIITNSCMHCFVGQTEMSTSLFKTLRDEELTASPELSLT